MIGPIKATKVELRNLHVGTEANKTNYKPLLKYANLSTLHVHTCTCTWASLICSQFVNEEQSVGNLVSLKSTKLEDDFCSCIIGVHTQGAYHYSELFFYTTFQDVHIVSNMSKDLLLFLLKGL